MAGHMTVYRGNEVCMSNSEQLAGLLGPTLMVMVAWGFRLSHPISTMSRFRRSSTNPASSCSSQVWQSYGGTISGDVTGRC